MSKTTTKAAKIRQERDDLLAALNKIINASNADPTPIHYKVREAIGNARTVIRETQEN